ncbi:MAG TPA: MBL fold metallo-hydrolase [Candidatus Acidoferrales bacterium]|nr:MBL fold metallo-hydrolase [Candidatus Acidoferrales bacterium]
MDPHSESTAKLHAAGAAAGHSGAAPAVPTKRGESRVRRWQVGDVKVTSIMESADRIPWAPLFPPETADHYKKYDWLVPKFITPEGMIILAVQAFVLEIRGKRIVIDTCVGNDRERALPQCADLQTAFLDDFKTAGFDPDSINLVLCTHLHFDHCGWNTRLENGRWVPTFPKARYLFGRKEWAYWQQVLKEKSEDIRHIRDSVQPIIDAGLADFVDTNHKLMDEVWLEPSHGHTPGHVSVHVSSRGQEAVVTGDVFHNPIQFAEPELCSAACVDKDMSRQTRRDFIARYGNTPVRFFAIHFNEPVGRVVRDAQSCRFASD